MTVDQVAHPLPAAPIRSDAETATPESSTRYCVSELIDMRCSIDHAGGRRVDQEEVDVLDAVPGPGQDQQALGRGGEPHVHLGAVEDEPVTVGPAVVCTPRAENPLPGSSQAGTITVSPETMRGNQVWRCSSDPAATMAPADSTQLSRCGTGASERPSSS